MPQIKKIFTVPALALTLASAAPAIAAKPQIAESKPLFYADVADVVSVAPVVAIATINNAQWLRKELAVNVPAGRARLLVTATVNALLRGDDGLPARIEYLIDVPLSPTNHPPKLRKLKVLIAASRVAGKPDMLRLVSAQAQLPWSPDAEAKARAILGEIVKPSAPPRIIGVGSAFHVKGSLPGESETQIFLKTDDERPVSLSILRRPGEQPAFSVALGEMVDEAAPSPTPDTLLWYRLACALPESLPGTSVTDLSSEDALAATLDYRFVIARLGACQRTPHP